MLCRSLPVAGQSAKQQKGSCFRTIPSSAEHRVLTWWTQKVRMTPQSKWRPLTVLSFSSFRSHGPERLSGCGWPAQEEWVSQSVWNDAEYGSLWLGDISTGFMSESGQKISKKQWLKEKCIQVLFGWECSPGWYRFAHIIELIIMDAFVDLFIMLCICINTLFMALDRPGMDDSLAAVLKYGNYVRAFLQPRPQPHPHRRFFSLSTGLHGNLHCGGCTEDHRSVSAGVPQRQVELLRCGHCHTQSGGARVGERQGVVHLAVIQIGRWPPPSSQSMHLTRTFILSYSYVSSSWLNHGRPWTCWLVSSAVHWVPWATSALCLPSLFSSLLWWACSSLAPTTMWLNSQEVSRAGTSPTSCTRSWSCSECCVESGLRACGTVSTALATSAYRTSCSRWSLATW